MKRPRPPSRARLHDDNTTSLALYHRTSQAAAAAVLGRYSTSFGSGARLLGPRMRTHIRSIYAMVRVADEIVDTYRGADARDVLEGFEREVHRAMETSFSANLVAHAFALTARQVGIGRDVTEPFFASMRMDVDATAHTQASFDRYVYGSAEVIGDMCLAVFVSTDNGPGEASPAVREGARRLGAAYQKINFLRDLAMDEGQLGRCYFPGVTAASITDDTLRDLVEDCRADMRAAEDCLAALPRRARIAVATTIDIYSRLLEQIAATPASRLCDERLRVANPMKAVLALRNACPWLSFTRRAA